MYSKKQYILLSLRKAGRKMLYFAVLTAIGLFVSLTSTALAVTDEAAQAANELHELGLFQGSGTDAAGQPVYDLDRAPNRAETIVMLVRLLGKEAEAISGTWETPFTDVPGWAEPYIGYAYANQLTSGTSETTFSSFDNVTAAQYITFTLRALGYSTFLWNAPWKLSDQIGLTDGTYTSANNTSFLRGDAVIISAAALDTKLNDSDKTLRDILLDPPLVDLTTRRLSDAQIAALDGKVPEELQAAVSTVADAKAYLNRRYKRIYSMACDQWQEDGNVKYSIPSAERLLAGTGSAGRSCISDMVAYLLDDDYDIRSVYGLLRKREGSMTMREMAGPQAVVCIQTGGQYVFVDPVLGMKDDIGSRGRVLLPEATTASVEEYAALIADNSDLAEFEAVYMVNKGAAVTCIDKGNRLTMDSSVGTPIYTSKKWQAAEAAYEKELEKKYDHIKPENISKYQLSKILGGLTMTTEDAYALVDAAPEVVKQQVKTAGDMLMYMLASRILGRSGDETMLLDGYEWHYNWSAKQVMEQRAANCGGAANLANYLLEGDYEEVGYIMYSSYPGSGGHIYNYFKYKGSYYIVDFTQYTASEYQTSRTYEVPKVSTLKEYGPIAKQMYGDVCLVLSFTSTGQHLPNIFGSDNYYYIPAGAEYEVLYQAADGFMLGEKMLDTSKLDWRKFW